MNLNSMAKKSHIEHFIFVLKMILYIFGIKYFLIVSFPETIHVLYTTFFINFYYITYY